MVCNWRTGVGSEWISPGRRSGCACSRATAGGTAAMTASVATTNDDWGRSPSDGRRCNSTNHCASIRLNQHRWSEPCTTEDSRSCVIGPILLLRSTPIPADFGADRRAWRDRGPMLTSNVTIAPDSPEREPRRQVDNRVFSVPMHQDDPTARADSVARCCISIRWHLTMIGFVRHPPHTFGHHHHVRDHSQRNHRP